MLGAGDTSAATILADALQDTGGENWWLLDALRQARWEVDALVTPPGSLEIEFGS